MLTDATRLPWKGQLPGLFCLEVNTRLETRLQEYLQSIPSRITPNLTKAIAAIFLGGSYGRGEGGIRQDNSGFATFHNNINLFVFTQNKQDSALLAWIQNEAASGFRALGIRVAIHVYTVRDVLRRPGRRKFYDLIYGHRPVYGPIDFFEPYTHLYSQGRLRLEEAAWLLCEKGLPLIVAEQSILDQTDAVGIQRIYAQLKLALGDALTIIHNYYSPLARARHVTLLEIPLPHPWGPRVLSFHREGVATQLYPKLQPNPSFKALAQEHKNLKELWACVFLYVEGLRLKRPFVTLEDYASTPSRLLPQHPWRTNVSRACRDLLQTQRCVRPIWDHPMAGLFRATAKALACPQRPSRPPSGFFLPTPTTWNTFLICYAKIAARYQ